MYRHILIKCIFWISKIIIDVVSDNQKDSLNGVLVSFSLDIQ